MGAKKDTVVEVHFPDKISIELVQANELRHIVQHFIL